MNFQPIVSDQDWSTYSHIRNRYQWSHPFSADECKQSFLSNGVHRKQSISLGKIGDDVKVAVMTSEALNASDGRHWISVFVDPADSQSYDQAVTGLREAHRIVSEFGGSQVMIEARSDCPAMISALDELGFEKSLTLPCSAIDVAKSDFESQAGVVSFATFFADHPSDGVRRLWRCEMDIAADLPLPFPFVETPFEKFQESILQPHVDLASKFLMFEDGEVKGLTQLFTNEVDPKVAVTGLTGTRREFRRQKVATRLKQHSISWAKERGVEQIFTDNEENNPMFQLNLQLGFRRVFDYVVYSKPC
ncbi:MAG: GNAT family N-acetyltransferase [Armatimonadetes bacterium]|nr:GNAT family N-acetyltransferase [Armatimonadota bacterium]